ncbi:MAG: cell wall hydrolase [Magnetospirillum sp.]|nr:cell wall hydrolase [Magnetospirillum sp.]
MDGRTIPFAVALALLMAGTGATAHAPPPSPEAEGRLVMLSPRIIRPALMVAYSEMQCLALNVYFEARGEPESGRVAVAHVTLNRVATAPFPETICGVVRQGGTAAPCQFQWYCDGHPDRPRDEAAWQQSLKAAVRALAGGRDPTGGALYFHHVDVHPAWAAKRYSQTVVIGRHVFFRLKGGVLGQQPVVAERGVTPPA